MAIVVQLLSYVYYPDTKQDFLKWGLEKQWNHIIKVLKENINHHSRILYSAKTILQKGFPGGSDGKESAYNAEDGRFDPWVRKSS